MNIQLPNGVIVPVMENGYILVEVTTTLDAILWMEYDDLKRDLSTKAIGIPDMDDVTYDVVSQDGAALTLEVRGNVAGLHLQPAEKAALRNNKAAPELSTGARSPWSLKALMHKLAKQVELA